MAGRITGKRENETGGNTHYRINGRTVSRGDAVKRVERGDLDGYHVYKRDGVKYLRDNPDNRIKDNIDEQPNI